MFRSDAELLRSNSLVRGSLASAAEASTTSASLDTAVILSDGSQLVSQVARIAVHCAIADKTVPRSIFSSVNNP